VERWAWVVSITIWKKMVMAYFTIIHSFRNTQEKTRSSLRKTVDNSFEIRSGYLQRTGLERYNSSSIFSVLFIIIQQHNTFNEKEMFSLRGHKPISRSYVFTDNRRRYVCETVDTGARCSTSEHIWVTWPYAGAHVPSAWSTQCASTSFLLNGPKSRTQQETWACFVWTFELHTIPKTNTL
jgi:hypothetical protein